MEVVQVLILYKVRWLTPRRCALHGSRRPRRDMPFFHPADACLSTLSLSRPPPLSQDTGIDYSSPKIRVLIQGDHFFARGVPRAATGTYLSLPRMGGDKEDSPEEEYMNQIIEGLLEGGRRASQAK